MNDDHDSSLPEGFDLRTLSAFVDGELPPVEHAAIEAQLPQQPQAVAKVAAWRAQKAALRALCGAPQRNAHNERSGSAGQSTADEPAFIVVRRP
ncbi:anti-sigma factor family protein, partial [Paraburkholderia sp.]|uniref:anti-sigma factor family protein n=1 Tax=Paraburkholderia sp. TaxID=1926495 RepID=UPI003C7DA820